MLRRGELLEALHGRYWMTSQRMACLIIDEDEGHENTDPIVQRELELLEFCRRNDLPVWFTIMEPAPNFSMPTQPLLLARAHDGNFREEIFKPQECAFLGTGLAAALQGFDTLIIAGAFYQSCIRETVQHAIQHQMFAKIMTCDALIRGPRDGNQWHVGEVGVDWYECFGRLD